jgi:hypothetical protein
MFVASMRVWVSCVFCQATDFADCVASGVLTADVVVEVESLRAQHADAVREKSAAESKNRRLTKSGRHGGREEGPPAPADGGEEGGQQGHC